MRDTAQSPEHRRSTNGDRRFADKPLAAIGWMLLGAIFFTVLDGTGKLLVRDYPVAQVTAVRYGTMTALLAASLAWSGNWAHLRTARVPAHLVRALLLVVTTVSVFSAVQALPLSQVYSISHLSPLLVAIFASFFLGERVRPTMWALIAVGFVGALVIIRPEVGEGASRATVIGILWSMTMAIGIAGYQTMTRVLGSTEHPTTQVFYSSVLGALFTLPFGVMAWKTPDTTGLLLMASLAISGYLAQIFLARAFTVGEAAMLAPFSYTTLIWSAMFDLAVFARLPGATTFAGAALIVASGLGILWIRWRDRPRRGSA